MNKKIILGIVGVLIIIGAVFFIQNKNIQAPVTTAPQTIKLGLMFPLTGQFAGIGEGIKNASLMAIEDYRASHPNVTIEIAQEDDGFDVKKGIPAYTKLTTLDKVDSIVMVSTPIVDALHDKMNADGIPVMTVGLQNDGVKADNIFQTTLAPLAPIEYMAKFVEGKNHKKIAVVTNSAVPAVKAFHDVFVKNYSKEKVEFIVNTTQDAKVTASKIMKEGVDGVVILEDAVGGPAIAKELLLLDKNKTLTYYFDLQLTTGWSEYQKLVGDTTKLNGAYALRIVASDTKSFAEKYKSIYKTDPAPYAEYGYDSIMIALNAYNKDKAVWNTNIQKTIMTGQTGKITFDPNGVRIQEVEMITVKDGKL